MLGNKNKVDDVIHFNFGKVDFGNKIIRFNNGFDLIDIYTSNNIDGKKIVKQYLNSRMTSYYMYYFIDGWSSR